MLWPVEQDARISRVSWFLLQTSQHWDHRLPEPIQRSVHASLGEDTQPGFCTCNNRFCSYLFCTRQCVGYHSPLLPDQGWNIQMRCLDLFANMSFVIMYIVYAPDLFCPSIKIHHDFNNSLSLNYHESWSMTLNETFGSALKTWAGTWLWLNHVLRETSRACELFFLKSFKIAFSESEFPADNQKDAKRDLVALRLNAEPENCNAFSMTLLLLRGDYMCTGLHPDLTMHACGNDEHLLATSCCYSQPVRQQQERVCAPPSFPPPVCPSA